MGLCASFSISLCLFVSLERRLKGTSTLVPQLKARGLCFLLDNKAETAVEKLLFCYRGQYALFS